MQQIFKSLFPELPDSSRIWLHLANRKLVASEEQFLKEELTLFLDSWSAHGKKITMQCNFTFFAVFNLFCRWKYRICLWMFHWFLSSFCKTHGLRIRDRFFYATGSLSDRRKCNMLTFLFWCGSSKSTFYKSPDNAVVRIEVNAMLI